MTGVPRVRIKPTRPAKSGIFFELDGDETITGGVGGWESLDRPRSSPAAAWVSTPPKQLEIPLALEGRDANGPGADRVVESDCRRIERWGLPTGKTGEPDILRVDGLVRVSTASRWVIQDITWGEYVLLDYDDVRIYQQLTLTLLEYSEAELVRSPALKARKRQKKRKDQAAWGPQVEQVTPEVPFPTGPR